MHIKSENFLNQQLYQQQITTPTTSDYDKDNDEEKEEAEEEEAEKKGNEKIMEMNCGLQRDYRGR